MASLKFYYDLMSQPSRAVYLFLKVNKIPFEPKPVAIRKGEHKTPEYTQINPFQKVPVIDDDGFILTESVSILSYLAQKYQVGSHWYPDDLQIRARIDEYNAWQHFNTRLNGAMVFRVQLLRVSRSLTNSVAILRYLSDKYDIADHWYPRHLQARARVDEYDSWQHANTRAHTVAIYQLQVIEPRVKNIPVNQEKLRRFQAELELTLDQIENHFLKDRDFLTGADMSIADLLGVCELMQPLATGCDVTEGRPKLGAWMNRVKERLQPHFDEAHAIVYRVRDMFVETSGKL